jgi:two-component system, NarL family, response regulator DesR
MTDEISPRDQDLATVRNYLSSALQKLDARNRIEAIRIAQQNGWL